MNTDRQYPLSEVWTKPWSWWPSYLQVFFHWRDRVNRSSSCVKKTTYRSHPYIVLLEYGWGDYSIPRYYEIIRNSGENNLLFWNPKNTALDRNDSRTITGALHNKDAMSSKRERAREKNSGVHITGSSIFAGPASRTRTEVLESSDKRAARHSPAV